MRSRHFGSYNSALIRTYISPQKSFAADSTEKVNVPKLRAVGLAGKVLSAELFRITTGFAGTTPGSIKVGDGTTVNKYFDTGNVLTSALTATTVGEFEDTGSAQDIETGRSNITITYKAPVTAPAGVADAVVVIAWY